MSVYFCSANDIFTLIELNWIESEKKRILFSAELTKMWPNSINKQMSIQNLRNDPEGQRNEMAWTK